MEWLEQLRKLIHTLFSNNKEGIIHENEYLPVKILYKEPPKDILEDKKLLSTSAPLKLLTTSNNDVKKSENEILGDFKPDDLSDNEIAHTYALIDDIKKTLMRQERLKHKERKKYETQKKERLALTKQRAEELVYYFEQLQQKPRHHMLCFIMYDIENNRIRTKVAKYLEEKGLKRVQKSVFFGEIDKRIYKQIYEVLLEIQATYENTDSLMLVPVSEDEVKSMKLIGKEVDFEYAIVRKNTLFF